jgi:lysophospholipase L1-like esterase
MFKRLFVWFYYLAWTFVYAGFLAHRSRGGVVFGRYSYAYCAFLLIALLPFAFPWVLKKMRAALGSAQRVLFALAPAVLLLALGYLVAQHKYYSSRVYPFHPFLQVPPSPLDYLPMKKRPGEVRILTLGGSTTMGTGLEEEDKYPVLLQQILREQFPQSGIEVLNGGKDWYTTEHALIEYAFYDRDWNPDVVVFFEAINDLYRSCNPSTYAVGSFRRDYSHFYGPAIRAYHPPSFESWLFQPIRVRWYSRFRSEPQPEAVPIEFFQSLSVYERNLLILIRLLRADQKRIVLATQASLFREDMTPEEAGKVWFAKAFCTHDNRYPDYKSMFSAMSKMNDAIRQVAQQEGIPLADLDAFLPKTTEYFMDDVHTTARGSRAVAQAIANTIVQAGYLK